MEVTGDRDWIRSQQDKAAGREFALKQQVIAQGVATGLELDIDDNLPKLVKDVAAGIKKDMMLKPLLKVGST